MAALVLAADTSAIAAAFGELAALIEAGDVPLEIGDRLISALEAGAELFTFQSNILPAADAHHYVVTAQPTKAFAVFMAAVRASNRDIRTVEHLLGHLESLPSQGPASQGCS